MSDPVFYKSVNPNTVTSVDPHAIKSVNPNTVVQTVEGVQVTGSIQDGVFYSADGGLRVTATGVVEHGVTDPTTNQFLVNGGTQTIDGRTVWGSTLDNGSFLSEDGTILKTINGGMEHGFTDGSGAFHAVRTIDGVSMSGVDSTDGGWFSDDGSVFVKSDGTVEHGITDPATKQFLAHGEVRTIDGAPVYGTVQNGVFYSEDGKILVSVAGVVEHGFTDGSRYFHSSRIIDGVQLYGQDSQGGGWLSDNGTVYVDSKGVVSHGLTDPSTGQFLVNGQVKTINGVQVWGSVLTDGSFLSEDGKTLVTSKGVVEHGYSDADGYFWAANTVNGQTVYGTFNNDGSFIAKDGTVYVDPSGKVETGISTPDGHFLPGGSTFKTSDGTTLYGWAEKGGGFLSWDGTTLVTPDGVVHTGTYDSTTGIFTPTGGGATVWVITQDGVYSGKVDPTDGAVTLSNGQVYLTPGAWTVDLAAFQEAITAISGQRNKIKDDVESIQGQYENVKLAWTSPAADTFSDVTVRANSAMDGLKHLLDDIVEQMRKTYDNYYQAETSNVQNMNH